MELFEPNITPHSRKEWREWLRKNHKKEKKVFLIHYKKHTGKPFLSHRETMEEAICWGWIDTTVKRIDEDYFGRYFMRRTDKSKWSVNTLSYAEDMIKKKLMTAEGMKRYLEGKKKGAMDHGRPKNPDPPEGLIKALAKNKKAELFFHSLSPSMKKYYIFPILDAKMAETKENRIKKVVDRCKNQLKPGI